MKLNNEETKYEEIHIQSTTGSTDNSSLWHRKGYHHHHHLYASASTSVPLVPCRNRRKQEHAKFRLPQLPFWTNNYHKSSSISNDKIHRSTYSCRHYCHHYLHLTFTTLQYIAVGILVLLAFDNIVFWMQLLFLSRARTTTRIRSTTSSSTVNIMQHRMSAALETTVLPKQQQQQQEEDYHWELCDPLLYPHSSNIRNEKGVRQPPPLNNIHDNGNCFMFNRQQIDDQEPQNDVVYKIFNPLPTMKRYLFCPTSNDTTTISNDVINEYVITLEANTSLTISLTALLRKCNTTSITKLLLQPARLFSFDPMIDVPDDDMNNDQRQIASNNMLKMGPPPIRTRFGLFRIQDQLFPNCNIPCYYDGEPQGNRYIEPIDYYDDGDIVKKLQLRDDPIIRRQIWTIEFSMEGPQYWSSIYINDTEWKNNHFWSTTSYDSEIPVPYFSYEIYPIFHNQSVPYDIGIKGAPFIASNCFSKNNREQIVLDMINILSNMTTKTPSDGPSHLPTKVPFRVDSIGACLNNAVPPYNISNTLENKDYTMKQYLFYLAFENQNENDYITEKLWGAYNVGTIPIYYGANNVKEHVPDHSLIHVNEYNSTYDLLQHIIEVSHNRTLYESYHKWRTQPIPDHFMKKYNITKTHATCRTCRWAYARMYGTGWNYTTQSIQPLQTVKSKRICFSSLSSPEVETGEMSRHLIQHPFVETWVGPDGMELSVQPIKMSATTVTEHSDSFTTSSLKCQYPLHDNNRIINIDNGRIQRTVYNHDGVIDMILQYDNNIDKVGGARKSRAKSSSSSSSSSSVENIVLLQLHLPLYPPVLLRSLRSGVWHVQNEISRYTILLSSTLSNSSSTTKEMKLITNTTMVQISIETGRNSNSNQLLLPLRIRIIVEDIDTFHKGANLVENYYGSIMTNDFFHPIQIYRRGKKNSTRMTTTVTKSLL